VNLFVEIDAIETTVYVRRPRVDGLTFEERLTIAAICIYDTPQILTPQLVEYGNSINFGAVRDQINSWPLCFSGVGDGHY
jgi:hypothetical protein